MAAPNYGTDLTPITLCDSGTFLEFTGYTAGTISTVPETDYYIQGGGCVSSTCKTTLNSIGFNYGSGVTVPTDGAVYFWQFCGVPTSMNTFNNGGQRCIIGSGTGDFKVWYSGGNDYFPNPYGGWKNVAIDPTVTADLTAGTPDGTLQYFGVALNLPTTYPSKGAMFGMDAIRYGRGELRVYNGEEADPATFTGMAAANDDINARWGIFQYYAGAFLFKGLITLGYGAAVYFVDANKIVLIDDTPRCGANFNRIEVDQSGSVVSLTNCVFSALGSTSKGRFEMLANAEVSIAGCLFKDMDTFTFMSNADIQGTTFLRCGQITAPGCILKTGVIDRSAVAADASAVVWNVNTDPGDATAGYLDNLTFNIGDNAHHAIEFGTTSPLSMNINGWEVNGFNASNGQNDSTFYVARTSGEVTISVNAGTGNFSYKSAGATVTIIQDAVTLQVTVKSLSTGVVIEGARVLVWATDGANYFYEEEVSITGVVSGTTATVAHVGHGMKTGDNVIIKGADQDVYNGAYQITVTGVDEYTYTTNEAIDASPATGTLITSTFAFINGTTNSSGVISDTRTLSSSQSVLGWVRKSSSQPYYQQGAISGSIDSVNGLGVTVQLVSDE